MERVVLQGRPASRRFPQFSPNARGNEARISAYEDIRAHTDSSLTCGNPSATELDCPVQRVLRHLITNKGPDLDFCPGQAPFVSHPCLSRCRGGTSLPPRTASPSRPPAAPGRPRT